MSIQFHETLCGKRFFEKQLPDLTKAINRLAEAKEVENDINKEKTRAVVSLEAFDEAKRHLIDNGIEAEEAEDVLVNICFILLGEYRISKNS